jgi:hypothetical protein
LYRIEGVVVIPRRYERGSLRIIADVVWTSRGTYLMRSDNIGPDATIEDDNIPDNLITTIGAEMTFCRSSAPSLQHGKADSAN